MTIRAVLVVRFGSAIAVSEALPSDWVEDPVADAYPPLLVGRVDHVARLFCEALSTALPSSSLIRISVVTALHFWQRYERGETFGVRVDEVEAAAAAGPEAWVDGLGTSCNDNKC